MMVFMIILNFTFFFLFFSSNLVTPQTSAVRLYSWTAFVKITETWVSKEYIVPSVKASNWGQLNVRMRVVTIIILLFFCKAVDLRRASPGGSKNRASHGRAGGGRRGSNPVKRYAPGLPCEVYTYLHEKYLDCQERKLVYVLPGWPRDLLHMLLARNKIRILKNNMFSAFKRLKSLDLQQNEISKIETEAFSGLIKLTTLLLQHNQIKVLTEEAFIYTPMLRYLRLYDNPWHCTCDMEPLISMLQIPGNRNLGNYAKCESPHELKNKKLRQVKSEEICNEEEAPSEPKPQVSGRPAVLKPEEDLTLCHNYMFPIQMLDCKMKGWWFPACFYFMDNETFFEHPSWIVSETYAQWQWSLLQPCLEPTLTLRVIGDLGNTRGDGKCT